VLPDNSLPDSPLPDSLLPDGLLPDGLLPDSLLPDGLLPDSLLPDSSLPDTLLPDTLLPDTLLPDTLLPDTLLPDAAPPAVCGNYIIEGGEDCDDGDVSGGDGCSATCQLETLWHCFGEPSACAESGYIVWVPGDQTTIGGALAAADDGDTIIIQGGSYTECLTLDDGRAITVIGSNEPVVSCDTGSDDAFVVSNGSELTLIGLQVGTSASGDDAIRVEDGGSAVYIHRCLLGPSTSQAVDARNGTTVWITESIITGAQVGGLRIWTDSFLIENNIIVGNTGGANAAAAAHFRVPKLAGSAFRFNTVVDNIADVGNGAIWCDGASVDHYGVIVSGTAGGADSVGCNYDHSLIGDTDLGGTNLSGDPMLDGSYHLLTGSSCINAGGSVSPTKDIDYQQRFLGAGPDIGADERE